LNGSVKRAVLKLEGQEGAVQSWSKGQERSGGSGESGRVRRVRGVRRVREAPPCVALSLSK